MLSTPPRFGVNYTPSRGWFHHWLDFDLDEVRRDLDAIAALGLDHVRVFPLWPVFQPNRTLIRPRAVADRYVAMDRLDPASLDLRAVVQELPPLVKGYLRLGGFVGEGAVLDHQFNTTDVCIVVKTDLITAKYAKHYERKNGVGLSE